MDFRHEFDERQSQAGALVPPAERVLHLNEGPQHSRESDLAIPIPVSRTLIVSPAVSRASITIVPPGGVNFTALLKRLSSICFSFLSSHQRRGKSGRQPVGEHEARIPRLRSEQAQKGGDNFADVDLGLDEFELAGLGF